MNVQDRIGNRMAEALAARGLEVASMVTTGQLRRVKASSDINPVLRHFYETHAPGVDTVAAEVYCRIENKEHGSVYLSAVQIKADGLYRLYVTQEPRGILYVPFRMGDLEGAVDFVCNLLGGQ